MNELFDRQMTALRRMIGDYRQDALDLNSLIQRIEGISDVLDIQAWRDAVFPVVMSMEQVNAVAIDGRRALTKYDKYQIEKSLLQLEALIDYFQGA